MTDPFQPELTFKPKPVEKPRLIVTDNSDEFFVLCDKDEAGELVIEVVKMGDGPGQWVCSVHWK